MPSFLHPYYSTLVPYTPGEQPTGKTYVKLNTNESPYPPAPGVLAAVCAQVNLLHRYPSPAAQNLVDEMCAVYNTQPQNIFFANGSDEILAFCFQALCPSGAAFADLSYGFYPVYCQLYQVNAQIIPLQENFTILPQSYYKLGRTIFIANPNAPTGLALSCAQIESILQNNPGNLVIIDEAYVDFGAQSAQPLLEEYGNLLIVGTFSKSRSLAGARLGYALGSRECIADLMRIKYSFNPFSLNRMSMAAGAAALCDKEYFAGCTQKIMATRKETLQSLQKMGFSCTQSQANFVFARHAAIQGQALYLALKEKGVLVRWFAGARTAAYIRITIGTGKEMAVFFEKLKEILLNTPI